MMINRILASVTFCVFVALGSTETILSPLGSIDGKELFYNSSKIGTWREAQSICENSGLRLAEIRTKPQLDLLRSNNDILTKGAYWTGGRDTGHPSQFIWDNSSLPIGTFFEWTDSNYDIQSCVVYYYSGKEGDIGNLADYDCESELFGILCETYESNGASNSEFNSRNRFQTPKENLLLKKNVANKILIAPTPKSFTSIGSFENTSYSVASVYDSWDTGHCKIGNPDRKFAEILSLEQLEFFISKYNDGTVLYGGYWLGGRDVLDTSRFIWDGSLESIGDDVDFITPTEPRACVVIDFWPSYPKRYILRPEPCYILNKLFCERPSNNNEK